MKSIGLQLSDEYLSALLATGTFTTWESKKRVDNLDPSLIKERQKTIGQTFEVIDMNEKPRARVILTHCFITTFGKPDPQFVAGMGYGKDVEACKTDYRAFWQETFPGEILQDSTEMFVTMWKRVP